MGLALHSDDPCGGHWRHCLPRDPLGGKRPAAGTVFQRPAASRIGLPAAWPPTLGTVATESGREKAYAWEAERRGGRAEGAECCPDFLGGFRSFDIRNLFRLKFTLVIAWFMFSSSCFV